MSGPRFHVNGPENVVLEFELAGGCRRGLAWCLDVVLWTGLVLGVWGGIGLWHPMEEPTVLGTLAGVVGWIYWAGMEGHFGGRTVGKWALGLRVLGDDGTPLTWTQAVVRNLFRALDGLPLAYLVGASCWWLSNDGRRLGDWAAGTLVIRERRLAQPAHLCAEVVWDETLGEQDRVRLLLSPEVGVLLVELALRRDQLPLELRLRIFAQTADYVSTQLGIDVPVYMSDETFCLSLTTLLVEGSPQAWERGRAEV